MLLAPANVLFDERHTVALGGGFGGVDAVLSVKSHVLEPDVATVFFDRELGDGRPVLEGDVVELILRAQRGLPVGLLLDAILEHTLKSVKIGTLQLIDDAPQVLF